MIIRTLLCLLCGLALAPGPVFANAAALEKIVLSPSPDEREIRGYIGSLGKVVDEELNRMRSVARTQGGRVTMSSDLSDGVIAKLKAVPSQHVEMLCKAATSATVAFRGMLVRAISSREDYGDAQKAVFLKYLPKLPDLIVIIESKNWFEGAEAVIAAGWKEAKKDERGGVLNARGLRYATIAARHGVKDALVTLAQMIQAPGVGDRDGGRAFTECLATVKAVVPGHDKAPAELADFILRNKDKLIFNPQTSTYSVSS